MTKYAMVMVNAFLSIIKNQYAIVMTSGKVQIVLAVQIKSLVKIKALIIHQIIQGMEDLEEVNS